MKVINIITGNFNKNGKGNFSGYDALGARHFVSKERMESFGIKTDAEFQAKATNGGIWAISVLKTYNRMNEDGEPTDETFERDTITALFQTKEDAINASIASKLVDIEAQAIVDTAMIKAKSDVIKSAQSLGLNETQARELITASL
jgi:hypothetical protein